MGRILHLQEGGLLEKWRTHWWPVTTACESQASVRLSQAKQLGIPKMAGLLVVYAAVAAAAVVCFLLTLCLHKTDVVGRVAKAYRTACCSREQGAVVELPLEDG